MIETNENIEKGMLALRITGKLTKTDLDNLVPSLETHVAVSEDPHLIMIMEEFRGWVNFSAFWKDVQLDAHYIGCFDRIAIVGDQTWQEWGTRFVNAFVKGELKFFSLDQAEQAWEWIGEKPH